MALINQEISNNAANSSNIELYAKKSLEFACKLTSVWTSSDTKGKEALQKLVFPNGIEYNTEMDTVLTKKQPAISMDCGQDGRFRRRRRGTKYKRLRFVPSCREEGIRMPTPWSAPRPKRLGPRYVAVYTLPNQRYFAIKANNFSRFRFFIFFSSTIASPRVAF